MNNRYAVMGQPVEHSISPIIHQLFAKQTGCELTYEKIQVDLTCFEQQVAEFFDHGGKGLNITLPCKERAFALADHVTSRCYKAKAANTLWRATEGLQADNTDGIGLLRDLIHYVDVSGKHILLLGAGGAARGILAPLLAANPAQLTITNRTPERAQALCKEFLDSVCALQSPTEPNLSKIISCSLSDLDEEFDLVINATSASLCDQRLILPASTVTSKTVCYDLAYNINVPTPFVAWAKEQGCVAVDGLGMLVEQAAEAFAIWHGVMPNVAPALALLRLQG